MSPRPEDKPEPNPSQAAVDLTSPADATSPPLPHERDGASA